MLIFRDYLFICCSAWGLCCIAQSFVTSPVVLPSPNYPQMEGFHCCSKTVFFLVDNLCVLSALSVGFDLQFPAKHTVGVTLSSFVLCSPHALHETVHVLIDASAVLEVESHLKLFMSVVRNKVWFLCVQVCLRNLERKWRSHFCVACTEVCRNQGQHLHGQRAEFLLFASPCCFSLCCAPACLLPWPSFFLKQPDSTLHHCVCLCIYAYSLANQSFFRIKTIFLLI